MKRIMPRSATPSLAVALVLTVVACSPPETASPPERVDPEVTAARLYVFDCGTLQAADLARFRLTKEEIATTTTNLPVPCFLVAHPQGRLMWDPGAVPDADWTPTGAAVAHHLVLPDGGERDLTLRKPLMTQLADTGYAPADITHLAFSHYHYDHTANANAFAGATWLVRQVERDAMFADKPPGLTQPSSYAALKTSKTVIIESDEYDVFGDGTVIMKLAAGHTPGHQVLYVKLLKTGGVVLSGDSLSFSRGTHTQACGDVRPRPSANARLERSHRSIPREDCCAAVDPARLRWQHSAQEGP